MPSNQEFEFLDPSEKDPFLRIIKKYQNHPSIKLIKAKNKSKILDSEKLILTRSKSLSKILTPKRHLKIVT